MTEAVAVSTSVPALADAQTQNIATLAVRKLGYDTLKD